MESRFIVSTDKSKLDLPTITAFLNHDSYWAQGRSSETIQKSIDNSLCFGVYIDDKQIGFARIVSDYAVFAWILDLFILEEYRGLGLSKKLMDAIMDHNELQNLQRWGLATNDAHGLYKKYGFKSLAKPEIFMERKSKPA